MTAIDLVAELKGHTDKVWCAIWHPSCTVIATSGSDAIVKLWRPQKIGDNSQWRCYSELSDAHKRTIRCIAFSPCGKYIACASFDSTTSVYFQRKSEDTRYPEYKLIATLEGHENEVKCVAWNSAGNMLATCGRDKSVWIWEMEDDHEFECLAVLQEHSQDVKSVAWHPSEDIVVSTSYDDTCKVWKGIDDDFSCVQTLPGHTSTVWSSSFHPSGDFLITGSGDRSIKLWQFKSEDNIAKVTSSENEIHEKEWQCISTLSGIHERPIYSVSWSNSNPNYVASVGGDNALCICSVSSSSISLLSRKLQAHDCDINSVCWHPRDSSLLLTAGDDEVVRLWQITIENM